MSTIRIYMSQNMEEYQFSILPNVRQYIMSRFPHAVPLRSISISPESMDDIQKLYADIQQYIYPTLLGLHNPGDIEQLGPIEIYNSKTEQIVPVTRFAS